MQLYNHNIQEKTCIEHQAVTSQEFSLLELKCDKKYKTIQIK